MIARAPEMECPCITVDRQGIVVEESVHRVTPYRVKLGEGVVLEMIEIPGGIFQMGSRVPFGYPDEHPQHLVSIRPFILGRFPVTQEQWEMVMPKLLPFRGKGKHRPVDNCSWNDASEFCRRLSKQTGHPFSLPSEAQWEYACRAGTISPFYFGETITTDLANYVGEYVYAGEPKGIYRHGTTDVGTFPPNAFGLYDMHGNVWEWCADAWHENYQDGPASDAPWEGSRKDAMRILRGGSWHEPPDHCRSAVRLKSHPGEREDYFGFRVAAALV